MRVSWFPTASRSILCFLALLPTPWKPLISLVDNEPFSDPPTSLNSSLLPQKPCTRLVPLSDARGCLEILTLAGRGAGGQSGSLFFCMGVDFFFFFKNKILFSDKRDRVPEAAPPKLFEYDGGSQGLRYQLMRQRLLGAL